MRASRWALVLVMTLAGCKERPAPAPSASAPPSAPPASTHGLDTPGNDPALVTAARKAAESCGGAWNFESGFDKSCADLKLFLASKVDRGTKDPTLVAFLDDESPKVRLLGAQGLAAWGETYRSDKALAERVLGAAEKESEPPLLGILGFLSGEIILAKTGLLDRVRALATRAEGPPELQIGLASILLQANRDDALAFDLSRDLSEKGASPMVRNAALVAFSAVYDSRPDEVCKLWVKSRGDADEVIAATAAARLCAGASWVGYSGVAWSSTSTYPVIENRCAAEVAPTLALIEGRARAGKITSENWLFALRGVLRADLKKTPPAQRQKALALARLIAETKGNNPGSRGSALRLVIEKDPKGKAFAATFAEDPNNFLRSVAAEAGPPKK